MSRDVLNITGEIECSVEPLQEGLNYLSDAFFVQLKADNEEVKLFAKERIFYNQNNDDRNNVESIQSGKLL